jgi:uncharacterized protein YwgA
MKRGIMFNVRNIKEEAIDTLLLLYLIKEAHKYGDIGKVMLQKLVFLVEREMASSDIRGFNFRFFRYNLGPFTEEIYRDSEKLYNAGLLHENEWPFRLTEQGSALLENIHSSIIGRSENREVLSVIEKIVSNYAKYDVERIKKFVYGIKIQPIGESQILPIREVPLGYWLIQKIDEKKAKKSFTLDEELIEDLEYQFQLTKEDRKEMETISATKYEDLFG